MFSLVKFFLVATLASSTLAGRHGRSMLKHRAVAAHVAEVQAEIPMGLQYDPKPHVSRKRSNSGRCKAKTSSSSSSAKAVQPTAAPKNVAPAPVLPADAITSTPEADPTTKKADPSPTTAAAPPLGGNQPSFMTGKQSGQGTFYGTGLGACGITNKDTDFIAAVSHLMFDTYPGYKGGNPNENPMCGRKVVATYQGKSVTVALTDRCAACAITDLDFSPSAFNTIADPALGRISGMTWVWA